MSNDFDQDILLCVCTVYIYLVGVIKKPSQRREKRADSWQFVNGLAAMGSGFVPHC